MEPDEIYHALRKALPGRFGRNTYTVRVKSAPKNGIVLPPRVEKRDEWMLKTREGWRGFEPASLVAAGVTPKDITALATSICDGDTAVCVVSNLLSWREGYRLASGESQPLVPLTRKPEADDASLKALLHDDFLESADRDRVARKRDFDSQYGQAVRKKEQ